MNATQQFILDYINDYERYEKTSALAAEICERSLQRNGIRAIVSYRTKKINRLEDKILKKYNHKNYQSREEILCDIKDLCGVRIALYFPGDIAKLHDIIARHFAIDEQKNFPSTGAKNTSKAYYPKIFSGYRAIHYRVHLLPHHHSLKDISIEIQIASVLMHAWAEVEHDLIYKPMNGTISEEEFALLDQINGLVLSGEIALERLQKAMEKRVSEEDTIFRNHFEFASFLYDKFAKNHPNCDMENIDELFLFLKYIDLDSPLKLAPYVQQMEASPETSVTQKVLNAIILTDPIYYEKYIDFKLNYEKKIEDISESHIHVKISSIAQAKLLFYLILGNIRDHKHVSLAKGESLSETIAILLENEDNPLYDYVYHLRNLFEDEAQTIAQDDTFFESTKNVVETLFQKYYDQLPKSGRLVLLKKLKSEGLM